MTYYNYHGIAKKLILQNHCISAEFKQNHNNISPALVLYFDNHKPMPIRESHFSEYVFLLNYYEINILNKEQLIKFQNKG